MAINQVSLSFYPPRWQERLTPHPRSLTDRGTPVQIEDAIRLESVEGPIVWAEEFRNWLIQQSFVAANWGRGSEFERGKVQSIFGLEKEIDLSFSEDAGELTSVYGRFTLSRQTPIDLPKWMDFAAMMCRQFLFRLGDGGAPCCEQDFLAAVHDNRFWQEFAKSYGWEPKG